MESTYGIGETARRTGLSAGALRFYDREGLLVPAHVDPRSGYRRYTADQVVTGRLVARLRRVGLALPDVARVLAHRREPAVVRAVLDAHLRRLETGLDLARRELSAVLHDLDEGEHPMTTLTLPAADLAAALRAVRFAVGTDPQTPALHGVRLDLTGTTLRTVATDRYRLAVSTAPVQRAGRTGDPGEPAPDAAALVPAAFADAVVAACAAGGEATLTLGARVMVEVGGHTLTTEPLGLAFPQWEILARTSVTSSVTLDGPGVRAQALTAATTTRRREDTDYEACVFRVTPDGLTWLAPDDAGDAGAVAVNRDFLVEAVDALDGDQLVLGLDGPLGPLALSTPDRPGSLSILMPVRLEATAG